MNQIMVLGTFHMQSKNDIKNFQQTDKVLNFENEIIQLVDAIATFNPTHIAVEQRKTSQSQLDAKYSDYFKFGSTEPNEVVQIGFRLAKQLGLDQVHAVDWMELGAVQHSCGEVIDYLNRYQPKLSAELAAFEDPSVDLEKETLRDVYVRLNSADYSKNTLAYYMNYARIGSDEYYGNGWLIWWYQRNLNIFTNTAALVEGEDEKRILLLIGSAHKGILEQFFQNSQVFEVVDAAAYLK